MHAKRLQFYTMQATFWCYINFKTLNPMIVSYFAKGQIIVPINCWPNYPPLEILYHQEKIQMPAFGNQVIPSYRLLSLCYIEMYARSQMYA